MAEAAENLETQETQETQAVERPDYIPEKFWNAETGQARLEEAFKSYTSLEQKMSGKKQAPEAYALEFDESIDKKMLEGIDQENESYKSLAAIAKEFDLPQAGFNKLMNMLVSSELAEIKMAEEVKAAEIKALGENAGRRIKDLQLWLDASLEKELAEGLKLTLTTAAGVQALEALKDKARAPSLKPDETAVLDDAALHDDLRQRYMAKDDNGNRKMRDPAYAKAWRDDAAAANYKA